MDLIKVAEEAFATGKKYPEFKAGDTITVAYKIIEGSKERIQLYRGVVIKISGHGDKKRFTVRKMSGTVGVERIFPIESPNIQSIEVNKVGKVRRAKLYYLRKLTGKAARIKEKRHNVGEPPGTTPNPGIPQRATDGLMPSYRASSVFPSLPPQAVCEGLYVSSPYIFSRIWGKITKKSCNFAAKYKNNAIKMKELALKYGCNPNQKPSRIFMTEGELPIEVINGRPGYINFLDAFNAWQLVKELKAATGLAAAASFKHVSPAGAAVGLPLSDTLKKIYFVDDVQGLDESPIACAYARARGADRMSSYGDFVALSDTCDATTAKLLKREVSDGVIAPDFTPEAIEILKDKRKGTYNVIKIDPTYQPEPIERKQVFGITFEQGRNEIKLDDDALFENMPTQNKTFTPEAKRDLIIALITLKYTQSNSVCYVKDGQAIGIGAGQQSRIHCTRLAGSKADIWWLRQHPKVMNLPFVDNIRRADRDNTIDVYISEDHDDVLRDGTWQMFFKEKPEVLTMEEKKEWIAKNTKVALGSDAFFPFGDNIERAHKSGVEFIAQAGGSVRDDNVIETCDKYGIAMAFTGVRLFHH